MMKRSLKIIIFGALCLLGVPVCLAYGLTGHQDRLQAVNQELDRVEYSGGNQAPAPIASPSIPAPVRSKSLVKGYKHDDFQFGTDLYWARYSQPKLGRQKGFMTGYNTRYTLRTSPNSPIINMYRVEGRWAWGKFKYQSDDGVVHLGGIKDNSYEIRSTAGKDFYPTASIRLTPYSGFGFRYLADNPEGLNTVVGDVTYVSYKTFSHYCYIPFGADFLFQRNHNFSVDSNLEFDYMVKGWEISKLGVLQNNYSTINNIQNNGVGLRASLRLNLYFKYITAFAEGFFRYWYIPQSNGISDPNGPPNPPLYVPHNSTQEYGLRLGLEM